MADDNFRRAMIITGGDISPFFTRPISIILWLLTLAVVLGRSTLFRKMLRSLKK
jgi:putative tricarboxylic transport membrane protein